MAQIVKDLGLKLRKDRKTQVISGLVLLSLIFLTFGDSAPRRRAKAPKQVEVGNNDPKERVDDLIQRFNGQLNQLTTQTNALREDVDANRKAMQDYEQTTAEIFKKILERIGELQNGQQVAQGDSQPTGFAPPIPDAAPVLSPELEDLGPADPPVVETSTTVEKPRIAAIMPGDSVRVKLLAGVNAPTDGTPYPVVLKLTGDVLGPEGNSIPLGEARVIAAAQGSLSDSRVLFRLTRLSLRLPNGRRKEFGIDGWVVGEDGIRGMEGVLIDPIGKAIVGAGMAGGLAGLGQGVAAANTVNRFGFNNGADTSFVADGKVGEYATGMGIAAAAREWQGIIRERLSQLVPVVQVLSNREGTAVFSQSLAIPDLLEQLEDEDPGVVYTSLD